ncbi:PREDICTED: tRNA dimethylallyltransferase, mitochondrial-like [Ceratosolen solmsi marchali]|uniref:tRNA dimethylallyltransferase, mitochondrial-like n=1 Tax=Ceratosolen solmsi marchali TaxID=326594 RepID=A0AAJ6VM21_9HYME|nr:PREDICTED: tRNA dimethylallyltransferase, mitochondrial-like [Ceratosolen solmsi marchali]
MSCVPILTILGSTCSGKSRLGIELARKFAGEIISADSMQVYKGLDIITAKVSKEEQAMAKHHMIDIIDPLYEFKVSEFKNRAVPIIDNLIENGKSPIIVGGTNYYIESLIWKILIDDPNISNNESDKDEGSSLPKIRRIEKDNLKDLYKKLIQVDPEMADRLHPNDKRKIIRSLEIFERHGIPQSEILKEQRRAGGSGLGGPLRYKNNIIFWLSCDKNRNALKLRKKIFCVRQCNYTF